LKEKLDGKQNIINAPVNRTLIGTGTGIGSGYAFELLRDLPVVVDDNTVYFLSDDVPPPPLENAFQFKITGDSFAIPVNTYNTVTYNWNVDWGDGTNGTFSGTSSKTSDGLQHTYLATRTYTITIIPVVDESGWFKAFGFYSNTTGANVQTNKDKVIEIVTPIITEYMRPVASYSHAYKFYGCSSLTSIPAGLLPATTMASSCYYGMFYGCSSLTTIPAGLLPATTMVGNCYGYMFQNCSLTDIGSIDLDWFTGKTAQTHMFFNDTKIVTPITYDQIPSGWK
jgi:hypothetical protein